MRYQYFLGLLCILSCSLSSLNGEFLDDSSNSDLTPFLFQAWVETKRTLGKSGSSDLVTKIHWTESGENFSNHLIMEEGGEQILDLIDSYNGSESFSLNQSQEAVILKVFPDKTNHSVTFDYGGGPLQPFQFLVSGKQDSNDNMPRLNDLISFLGGFRNSSLAFTETTYETSKAQSFK